MHRSTHLFFFRLLFSGSEDGRVQAFHFPLTLPGEWAEHLMHGDAVTQLRLSADGRSGG